MKHIKLLTILGLALFVGTKLFAEPKPTINRSFMPYPGQFVSEAVYLSSTTCSDTVSIFISTRPAFLYGIDITSAGINSTVKVYDATRSTQVAGVREVAKGLNSNSIGFRPFNVGLSSGLAVSNLTIAGTPACINILYYER